MRKIEKLRESPHWSYTALNCYLTCPLKYQFQYLEHAEPEHTSACLPFGKAFHAVLSERARHGSRMKTEDIQELFATYLKVETSASERLQYKANENFDSLLQLGFSMLRVTLNNWQDDFAVKSVEEAFSVDVPGLSKPLIGEYDMVVEDGNCECIVDWKTSSSKWTPGKAHRDLQATLFCYARNRQTGTTPLFRFDVITKTKSPATDSHYTERREQDFQRMEQLLQEIESAVQRGVFYPNETCFSCNDCQFKNKCRQWHIRKG